MNCQKAIQRLIKLQSDLLQHFNHSFLSGDDILKILEEIERLISYIKLNCTNQIDINVLNRLEFLLKALKHFFNIKQSIDELIRHNKNLKEFFKIEITEIIEKLKII